MATLYAYSPNGTQATLSYSVIGFTQSLQQNGWCKLPNGLILQWGFKQNLTLDELKKVPYSINYTKNPLITIVGKCDTWYGGSSEAWTSVLSQTVNTFNVYLQHTYEWYYFSLGQ